MSLEFLIELLLIAGIVNGNYPCMTWELNGNNISLICRIKNQVEPVSFIDSKGNLKDKCTLNNTRKCETFQINADTIAHTYKNEVVLMINDYERKCFINDEWTCSEGNSTLKTVVSTSKGILSDTNLTLSLLNSPTLQRVTLICYSSRVPHGYHVEFLKNGKSVDSITYNMVSRKCTHISGECLPDKCSCNPSGNYFTRIFPFIAGNKTTTFSCSMKFVYNDTSSILLKISTVLFDKQAFIYIGTNTSILKPAENENEMNDENRNVPEGRDNDRTDSSLNIVNPGEIIKWVAIGVAFAMPCIVAIIFKVGYRVFRNSKKKHDENKSILELDCKDISRKHYSTEPTLECQPLIMLMNEKEISGKHYETEPTLECQPQMDEKEISGPMMYKRPGRRNMSVRMARNATVTTKIMQHVFAAIAIGHARINAYSTMAINFLNQKTIPTTEPATETIYQRCAPVSPESIKQVPPREDVKLSPNLDYIQYSVKFMIVGRKMARRLPRKGIEDVFSSDGVDIEIRSFKIDKGYDLKKIGTGIY